MERPVNKGRHGDTAPAAVNHLTGGAVPLPDHRDSFEGQKRRKKEPSVLKSVYIMLCGFCTTLYMREYFAPTELSHRHFRNLEIKNQQQYDEKETGDFTDLKSVTGYARRRIVQPPNMSSPNDLHQRTRFKRPDDATAHKDHIWDLNRNWAKDHLRTEKERTCFDDPYPWQAIDEDREMEHQIVNYPPIGRDPPRAYNPPSGNLTEPCWDPPSCDEASQTVASDAKGFDGDTDPTEGTQLMQEPQVSLPVQRQHLQFSPDDFYRCEPHPDTRSGEGHNVTRIGEGAEDATQRIPEHTCQTQEPEPSFRPNHGEPLENDYTQGSTYSCQRPRNVLASTGDNCPVAGESAQVGNNPSDQNSGRPDHVFTDELPPTAKFHKMSPHFGASPRSSDDGDVDQEAYHTGPEKIRMVSHMAVPSSKRPAPSFGHKAGVHGGSSPSAHHAGHFRSATRLGAGNDPEVVPVGGAIETEGEEPPKFRQQTGRELRPRPSNPPMEWQGYPADVYARQVTVDP
eukprot:Gregarina_sp_Poly_1__6293@NODE_333_length_9463_cov_335_720094_g281_i0_p2_GENE_NODE_333_length_9463_cov_335_720094_g281_i0NODE_333_length_9463_cov_335_720094_g281_i0_p2_ORF_typecomplete_len511_score68_78_NODE_333_length_9463_cov_335_720094_g281_i050826614